MKSMLYVLLMILSLCTITCRDEYTLEGNSIQSTLEKLQIALNQNDFTKIEPLMADNFSFNGYDGEMGRMIMSQVVSQYPKKTASIKIRNVIKSDTGYIVAAEFVSSDEIALKELLLSLDFKIQKAPIIDIQIAGHGSSPGSKSPEKPAVAGIIPAKMVVPFELAGGLITVKAEIEGVWGTYIVDSGAAGNTLNSKYFPELMDNSKPLNHPMGGVGGSIESVRVVTASNFKWQETELNSMRTLIYDLSHLEKNVGIEIKGLIGAEFLEDYVVVFDYDQLQLTLYSNESNTFSPESADKIFDIEMIGHIPVLEIEIGGRALRVGLDSGAEEAMLSLKWENLLIPQYTIVGKFELTGADLRRSMRKKVQLDAFQFGDLNYENHQFVFADLNFGSGVNIDGLLGFEFLSQHKTAVDLKNEKIYIWETSSHTTH
ncbi:aspartyl protease family protein [bacterium]|nr:aspartyl protease family protein [bacterium]